MAVALIVAAGRGERLGAEGPKAFVLLGGRPLVAWSLSALAEVEEIDEIVVAVPPGAQPLAELASSTVVPGGAHRSVSVRNALAASGGDPVVVHDAARPLAEPALFRAALAALDGVECAIAAAPVTDTVKEAGPDGIVRATLDRSALWAVQTPQVFRRAALEQALAADDATLAAATDDAQLVERAGGRVRIVPAPRENLKVTTPGDLALAERLLHERAGAA